MFRDKLMSQLSREIFELGQKINDMETTDEAWSSEEMEKLTQELSDRARELDCLYAVSNLGMKENLVFEEMLQSIIDLLPHACVINEKLKPYSRIIYKDLVLRSFKFKETVEKIASKLFVKEDQVGVVEVYFPPGSLESACSSLIEHKKLLVNSVSTLLGKIIEARN